MIAPHRVARLRSRPRSCVMLRAGSAASCPIRVAVVSSEQCHQRVSLCGPVLTRPHDLVVALLTRVLTVWVSARSFSRSSPCVEAPCQTSSRVLKSSSHTLVVQRCNNLKPGCTQRRGWMSVAPHAVLVLGAGGVVATTQQQISPYFNPTYTRTGWIGQPPVLDRHEVVTIDGDVVTLRQATP